MYLLRPEYTLSEDYVRMEVGGMCLTKLLMACRNRFAVVRTPRGPRIERGRKGGFADRQSSRQEGPEDRAYREPRQDRAGWATSPASKWATSETPQWSEQATGYVSILLAIILKQDLHLSSSSAG